jgi:hypothetical protein
LISCDCKLNENYCYEEIRFILHGLPPCVTSRVTSFEEEGRGREKKTGKISTTEQAVMAYRRRKY